MKLKIFISIFIILGGYMIWYFIPKQHDVTLDGVFYQLGNEEVIENVKIHLDGKIQNHINGKKSFEGTVEFQGNGIPRVPKDRDKLSLLYNGENWSVLFSGFRYDNETIVPDIYTYGVIYINDEFSEFTVPVNSNDENDDDGSDTSFSWTETDGLMITAPAGNRDEALEISNKLMKDIHKISEPLKLK